MPNKKIFFAILLFVYLLYFRCESFSMSFDCEEMLEKTPKEAVVEKSFKIMTELSLPAIGICIIYPRSCPVVLSAEVLLSLYISYELMKNRLQLESRDGLIKKGLSPPYYEFYDAFIEEVDIFTRVEQSVKNFLSTQKEIDVTKVTEQIKRDVLTKDVEKKGVAKTRFKKGEYIPIVLRHRILTEKPEEALLVQYFITLYYNNHPLIQFKDEIILPQGDVGDLFYIPVCGNARSGKYRMEITATSKGYSYKKSLEWEVE